MHRITTIIATLLVALTLSAIAVAATHETASFIPTGAPAGYLKINPQTCRFLHPEIDVRPNAMERYARAEDSRDDVKLSCLTRKLDTPPKITPPPADTCWTTPPPVTEAKPDRQGFHDETGAKALDAWAVSLAACEAARNAR